MNAPDSGPVPFANFLRSKFALDERSLNRDVREAFLEALQGLPQIQCLDVGAGTGATLQRLLQSGLTTPLFLTALDRDASLLDIARNEAAIWLGAMGLEPHITACSIQTYGKRLTTVQFRVGELKHWRPDRLYNVITAHAFLDIVPLAESLRQLAACLQNGGYLYASSNYDGYTALFPTYDDATFETTLLDYYNVTMEQRRVDGLSTGGAYCGRRLHGCLPDHGFDTIAYGSSHWNITPFLNQYRDGDAICLQALLDMILDEARNSGPFDLHQLNSWYEDRMWMLKQQRLGLIIHQLDFLARYRA